MPIVGLVMIEIVGAYELGAQDITDNKDGPCFVYRNVPEEWKARGISDLMNTDFMNSSSTTEKVYTHSSSSSSSSSESNCSSRSRSNNGERNSEEDMEDANMSNDNNASTAAAAAEVTQEDEDNHAVVRKVYRESEDGIIYYDLQFVIDSTYIYNIPEYLLEASHLIKEKVKESKPVIDHNFKLGTHKEVSFGKEIIPKNIIKKSPDATRPTKVRRTSEDDIQYLSEQTQPLSHVPNAFTQLPPHILRSTSSLSSSASFEERDMYGNKLDCLSDDDVLSSTSSSSSLSSPTCSSLDLLASIALQK
mmetsp:Transcript_49792/g.63788  ORF Transcript_49792/g.63788 Transcript_49792/m.63788 type:complete len:305 (+) Transcript_49792:605-1519(+)